jgi:hypothetical protein
MKKNTYIYYLCKDNGIPFYIGKTQNPINIRLADHTHKKCKDLQINIIDEVPTHEWKFWEKHYISLYKSWGFKLENKNNGGNGPTGGYLLTQETKDKIGTSNSKPKPKGFGNKLSKIKIGIPLPLGTGDKISQNKINHKCYKNSKRGEKIGESKNKPIIQYDLNGEYIKEWESGKQAAKYIQIAPRGISLCCREKGKTAGGYIWKFKILNNG